MSPKRRGRLLNAAKLIIGLGLLAALLLIDDNWRKVIDIARDIQVSYLIPFVGVSALTIWISCVKWRLFLRDQAIELPLRRLMGLYIIGYFFNNFLPSNFGGDAARSYILGRQIDSQGRALATVFLERFTGFLAMVSLAAGAFLLNPGFRGEPFVFWSILVMGALTIGVLIVILRPGMLTWIISPLPMSAPGKRIIAKVTRFHGHIAHFRGEWSLIARAMFYSYGFYGIAAIKVYIAGLLLGIHCNLAQLFVVTPIAMLIAAIPLTPNSVGIQEWGYSLYLTFAGVTLDQGLAIALALRAMTILMSVLGGFLFLLESDTHERADISEMPIVDENV